MEHLSNKRSPLDRPTGLYLSLIAVLAMLTIITIGGVWGMHRIQARAERVVSNHLVKIHHVVKMREAARERTHILERMFLLEDVIEWAEAHNHFNEQGGLFIAERTALMQAIDSNEEKKLLALQGHYANLSVPLQHQIVDLMALGEYQKAKTIFLGQAIPLQAKVLDALNQLYDYQTNAALQAQQASEQTYADTKAVMISLSVLSGLIILLAGLIIIRRTKAQVEERENNLLQVQHANKAKSAFLAIMSHEIRTPLTAIIGFADSCLEETQTREQQQQALRTIVTNGEHLLQIINDILDISKIEAEKLEIANIDCSVVDLLRDVQALVQLQIEEKGLTFAINYHFPIPKRICCDPLRLKQILLNLCSNAIKFTDKGHVNINLRYDKPNRQLVFNVVDTGIGMTRDQLQRIFHAFTQADSTTTRQYGGTGLGLSLSKKLVELMGGEISVDSQPGIGSDFCFSLDVSQQDNLELITYLETPGRPKLVKTISDPEKSRFKGHILVAEDNLDNQRLIEIYISRIGVDVTLVNNGQLAVEAALQQDYDLILMDMQMPIMDGITAVKTLRGQGYDRPIIALTANAMQSDKEICLQAGYDGFVTKPIQKNIFYQEITKYLPTPGKVTSLDELRRN